MKKIIYKNKLKKFVTSLLLTVIVFQCFIPSLVWAKTETLNQYLVNMAQSLGTITWEDEVGNKFEETVSDYVTNIDSFWSRADYENIGGLKGTGLSDALCAIIEKVISKIKQQDMLEPKNNVEDINYLIYLMMQNEGDKISIQYNGETLSNVDISMINLEKYRIVKGDPNKTEEEKLEEDGIEKISEGIYKYKNGRYFCTVNIAGEIWEQNYIYGLVQDWMLQHVADSSTYYDCPKIFENYGDDAYKMRVYFDNINADKKPTGDKPVSSDIQIFISKQDIGGEEYRLPEGEEPTYYSDKYWKEKSEDSADLGGLLLSPVLSLINFVADAVMSVTQKVMMPEKASLIEGVLVHNAGDVRTEYERTVDKEVNTESFLPSIGSLFSSLFGGDSVRFGYPNIVYTPEEIFAGKVDLLSIDFISGKNYQGEENKSEGWLKIREVISQWYQILRMIAIIGLLSVLIYTGIKIIISSNAKDKAKYKEWISNWFMAVAILFSMHFIMAFIISTTGEFSKLLAEACQGINVIPSTSGSPFNTNLMGLTRFMVQSENFYIKVGYEVMYIALIFYTLKFTMIYLKRVLNMAFLTLIAPIVALTYPIDKINDGRAQGFDMWLKEYIFNALLQPMHQVLYYVLVGSAVSVAANNPLYGIAVLAFMTQAEKLLKKIFGFDKAGGGTVGGMSTAFAAGALASNLSKLAKLPKGGKGGAGTPVGSGPENIPLSDLKPTTKDRDRDDALFKDSNTNSGGSENNEPNNSNNENDSDESEEENGVNPNGQEEAGRNREQPGQNGKQNEGGGKQKSGDTGADEDTRQSQDDRTPIREKAKKLREKVGNSKLYRGSAAVGKRLAKPVWDFDHKGKEGRKYNRKRLMRKVGRVAVGASLGIGAAAVQAGISITDGKYNPMEGIASFAAGYAGGGQVSKGFGSLWDTYKEGTLPDEPEARKREQMERVLKSFSQREDVIKHNRSKYASADRDNVINIQKQLLEQGITDLGEMDDIIKYIKKTNNGNLKVSDDTVRKARSLHDFSNDSNVQKVMYDQDKTGKYIDSVAGNDAEKRKILENKFKESIRYADIVNKK